MSERGLNSKQRLNMANTTKKPAKKPAPKPKPKKAPAPKAKPKAKKQDVAFGRTKMPNKTKKKTGRA